MLSLSFVLLIWKQYCQQIYDFPATQYLDNFINKTFPPFKVKRLAAVSSFEVKDSQRIRDSSYRWEVWICMDTEI